MTIFQVINDPYFYRFYIHQLILELVEKYLKINHITFQVIFQSKYHSSNNAASIPGSGRSPGERNGNPLQYSCLKNPMDRGDWWATVHGVARSHV